jgi:hypothetical protein
MVLPVVDVHGRALRARHLVPGPVPVNYIDKIKGKIEQSLTRGECRSADHLRKQWRR